MAPLAKSVTVQDLRQRKGGEPIVCLTAYSTVFARLLDPLVDLLLVGDSLGMVHYGLPTTLAVDLDSMIRHGQAVVRGAERAMVVVDLPFGSYQESPVQAFRASARVLAETGCTAVKLEGGAEMAETIAFLVERGVPVLGHVGLKPQSVQAIGGFRAQGRDAAEAAQILADAKAVEAAGAFATVIEGTLEPVARRVTAELAIPTIGIGASAACDGQILVTEDLLGLSPQRPPRFVKRYADLAEAVTRAIASYAEEVRARRFPSAEFTYAPADGEAPKDDAPQDEAPQDEIAERKLY
jgi:3-methyl-2-oxobutanoate hydroxymethyltransferase